MTLVQKIKEAMEKELQADPDITDKEYEQLFIKYYQYFVSQGYLNTPQRSKAKKNGY